MQQLTISGQSRYLRAFIWLWDADRNNLNLCKLFWGTLCSPAALIGRLAATRYFNRIITAYLICSVAMILVGLAFFVPLAAFGLLMAGTGLVYIPLSYFFRALDRKWKQKPAGRQGRLSNVTRHGSAAAEWVAENTIGRVMDAADNLSETRGARRIGSIFSVIWYYLRSLKQRTCLKVTVV